MKHRAIAAVVMVAGLALLAAPAQAGWRIDRAVAVADAVWGNQCPWRIEWAQPPASAPDAIAWASGQDDCRFGSAVVYLSTDEPIHTFDVFCTRVLHERGHTVGAVHSSNPRSVMYSIDQTYEGRHFSDATNFTWRGGGDPRCRNRGRPYLERHGVLAP